jgi:hypothetical protein
LRVVEQDISWRAAPGYFRGESTSKFSQQDFPIKAAYQFAAANGLGPQAETSGRILFDMIEKA